MIKSFFALIAALFLSTAHNLLWAYEGGEAGAIGEAGAVNDPVEGWHHLWHECLIDIAVMGVIFATVTVYLLVKYKRNHPDQVGTAKELSTARMWGWLLIPVFVFVADDLYLAANSWGLWNTYRNVPDGAYEIKVEAMMWEWNFTYPNGVEVMKDDGLRVPVDTPILFRMTSSDVIHSLWIPDFKVKEDSMPGRFTYYWIYPKEPGEHVFTCAEYCGENHSNMSGKLIVMPREEFNKWIEEAKGET